MRPGCFCGDVLLCNAVQKLVPNTARYLISEWKAETVLTSNAPPRPHLIMKDHKPSFRGISLLSDIAWRPPPTPCPLRSPAFSCYPDLTPSLPQHVPKTSCVEGGAQALVQASPVMYTNMHDGFHCHPPFCLLALLTHHPQRVTPPSSVNSHLKSNETAGSHPAGSQETRVKDASGCQHTCAA